MLPGTPSVMPVPMLIEQRRSGRRELHDAELVAGAVVDVDPEAGLLVERLAAVHVRDGKDHDLEPHVHDGSPGA